MLDSLLTLRKILAATNEHRHVEQQVNMLFSDLVPEQYRSSPHLLRKNRLQYLQRNFFSSLFLSIYQAVGIPPERRLFYGIINHCIRGIVTGTDNLLDDEYKALLPFAFPEKAIRFKSVMHILCFDRFLETTLRRHQEFGMISASQIPVLQKAIFQTMLPIGAGEADEEPGIETILTPEEIIRQVHFHKGGKLLCLAFIAPLQLETENHPALVQADLGILRIGLALQVIDDITDFHEDTCHKNHNYLTASVHAHGTPTEQAWLEKIRGNPTGHWPKVEETFPETLQFVMCQAIGEAIEGFSHLRNAGYGLNTHQALKVIRFLFEIRGLSRLLPFFPRPDELSSLTLSHPESCHAYSRY